MSRSSGGSSNGAGEMYFVVTPDNFDWFLENVVRSGNTRSDGKI